jgi:hypothetical protein
MVREVSIDPVMFTGIPWTKDLERGNFVAVAGVFPDTAESYAEWDPTRMRYQAHAVGDDGTEYVANAVFAGYVGCFSERQLRNFVVVEGMKTPRADTKVITLSTLLDHAYDLRGQEIEPFDYKKFQKDAKYRKDFVRQYGTSLAAVSQVNDVSFAGWTLYKANTKGDVIAAPFDNEKRVKVLAGINPQYTYWEKLKGTAHGSASADYVGSAISLMFDFMIASQAKSQGFDYQAGQTRLQRGFAQKVFNGLSAKNDRECAPLAKYRQ